MKKEFPSKVSYGLLTFIFLVFYGPLIPDLISGNFNDGLWGILIFLNILFILILHLFINTRYIIEDDQLKIKAGFLSYKPIEIASIKEISNSGSLIASPAPSFDRIEIKYGNYKEVYISPKNKTALAAALIEINPSIRNNIV